MNTQFIFWIEPIQAEMYCRNIAGTFHAVFKSDSRGLKVRHRSLARGHGSTPYSCDSTRLLYIVFVGRHTVAHKGNQADNQKHHVSVNLSRKRQQRSSLELFSAAHLHAVGSPIMMSFSFARVIAVYRSFLLSIYKWSFDITTITTGYSLP